MSKKITREQMEQTLKEKKWIRLDSIRIDLVNVLKTAKLATESAIDTGDLDDLVAIVDLILTDLKRATDSLQESIEEWQSGSQYLD